jgi:hypothetical protein
LDHFIDPLVVHTDEKIRLEFYEGFEPLAIFIVEVAKHCRVISLVIIFDRGRLDIAKKGNSFLAIRYLLNLESKSQISAYISRSSLS